LISSKPNFVEFARKTLKKSPTLGARARADLGRVQSAATTAARARLCLLFSCRAARPGGGCLSEILLAARF
jgi:hypothetical protein